MKPLWTRFLALPRAGQWLAALAIFLGIWFGGISPLLDRVDKLNVESDKMAKALKEKVAVRQNISDSSRTVEQVVKIFGEPSYPAVYSEASASFERRINQVFNNHKVANQKISYRDPAVLTTETEAYKSLVGVNQQLSKLGVEITFETDMPTLVAILRDLEDAPEIAAVSRLSMRKTLPAGSRGRGASEAGTLSVTLNAEAWTTQANNASRSTPSRSSGGDL